MPRDPETGQFVADDRGDADPYLNTKTIVSTNAWDAAVASTHTFDNVDGRDAQQEVELERPDDHLIEIYGFLSHVGDPAADGDLSKFDIFVVNDEDAPPVDTGWPTTIEQDDELVYTCHGQSVNNRTWVTNDVVEYPKPILSTGKLGVLFRNSPDGAGGEYALSVMYGYREFDDQQILKQLLEMR